MGHVANLPAHTANVTRSKNRDFSLRGMSETGECPQQRGLPCPVVTEDGVQPARNEFRTYTAQSRKASELLDEIGYAYDGRRGDGGVGVGQRQWGFNESRWVVIFLV